MSKRDIRRWASQQTRRDVQPWPRWVRWAVIGGALLVVVLKLLGVL